MPKRSIVYIDGFNLYYGARRRSIEWMLEQEEEGEASEE